MGWKNFFKINLTKIIFTIIYLGLAGTIFGFSVLGSEGELTLLGYILFPFLLIPLKTIFSPAFGQNLFYLLSIAYGYIIACIITSLIFSKNKK